MLGNRIDISLPLGSVEVPVLRMVVAQVGSSDLETARAGCDQLIEELGRHGDDVRYSRSHCQHWIAVAAAGGLDIGVDIELARKRDGWRKIAEFVDLGATDRSEFWQRWTLREAIAKCVGGSVLVKEDIEADLSAAVASAGEWFIAEDTAALCGRLDVGLYYSLVVNGLPKSDQFRCA